MINYFDSILKKGKVPAVWDVKVTPSYNGGSIVFDCKFTTKKKDDRARYEVTWYQGDSTKPFRTTILKHAENRDTVQNDHEAGNWHFLLGKTVRYNYFSPSA